MQDDNFANVRGQQDQYSQEDRQRVLRAQQEAQQREQLEQDEDEERARSRIPGARPGAIHALQGGRAFPAPSRASADPGPQKSGRSRAVVLGLAVVAALAFAGYKYTRIASVTTASVPGPGSPLTAGLPPLADEPARTEPAGPALPTAPAVDAQSAKAETSDLLRQVSPAPQVQTSTGIARDASTSGAVQAPAAVGAEQALQQRVQSVETLVQELGEQLARLEGRQSELAAKASAPRTAPRPRRTPRPLVTAPATPEPAAPKLAGRLLAVDSWGGVPSVIVGTGIPGDKRTRVLRPGDTYNGISLVEANRARGEATFMANGKQFRLTLLDAE